MKSYIKTINKIEFEYRIFVSLSIVLFTCFLSFRYLPGEPAVIQIMGSSLSADAVSVLKHYFILLTFLIILMSLIRMWAGSLLSSERVMSFKIKDDLLVVNGPYKLTRNPIYFSDFAVITGLSLCLPLPGLLMPVLFYIHYRRLIKYEEEYLENNFQSSFKYFLASAPVLVPNIRSIRSFLRENNIFISSDGFRNNSLYILFIPGLIVSAFTGDFLAAVIIGGPGVIYWAVVHTKIGTKKNKAAASISGVFNGVLYSQCWEDPRLDRKAFNIKQEDIIFSITSGGCNSLTFLIDNPARIYALDLNPHQNYLLELKMAAFRNLSYEECIAFLGVKECKDRLDMFSGIKNDLSNNAREFWNSNPKLINQGIIHCGRYEKYMKLLRNGLNIMIGKKIILKFFNTFGFEALEELYNIKWDNIRWKIFTRVFLSRKTMSLLFDKNFFKYVPDSFSFGSYFAVKTRNALTQLPVRSNYFLSYILLGRFFDTNNLPVYLRPEYFEIIKQRLDRITIINDSCENYFLSLPDSSINKFNFTNIFEWMSEEDFSRLLNETIRVAANGAIITYRNLLVYREHPYNLNKYIKSHKSVADSLLRSDLSFIYNNYVIEEIIKEEKECYTEQSRFQIVNS